MEQYNKYKIVKLLLIYKIFKLLVVVPHWIRKREKINEAIKLALQFIIVISHIRYKRKLLDLYIYGLLLTK